MRPPPPLTYQCTFCGWRKAYSPRSDAIRPGLDRPICCPVCDGTKFEICPPSLLERLSLALSGKRAS